MCAANYDHLGVPDLSSGRLNTILSEETEGEGDGEESNDTQTRGGRKNRLVRRHQRWSDSNHRGKMEQITFVTAVCPTDNKLCALKWRADAASVYGVKADRQTWSALGKSNTKEHMKKCLEGRTQNPSKRLLNGPLLLVRLQAQTVLEQVEVARQPGEFSYTF